ncbi:28S rRNA (cytosine-C(5))-methyltransferase [Galleria mellonella]|uniref:28S rRNA (Cytosine-C(5))-methyltransferase n=1 Tax=Galleria mellonella TaxID=7137 RepID=A0ABM3MR10_GALME|nr:28S rRNA (cytosine-C(5))-methyltransferase [Galleria mellonella]
MFEHSIKVPRHYKVAANIFKKVSTEGGSVKSLLYDDKLRHFRTNVLYALITETIKHAADIDKIFNSCSILENESRLDPWLAKVLTAELLFGKKTLPGKSKPEQTVLSYKDQFEKYATDHQDDLKTEVVRRPRYVRINTNLLTTSDAIRAFQDEGYRFIRCTSGAYDDYLKQIQSLTEYDFTQDYHVKTVFVFPSGTKLHEHELYLENKIILQDKATALAVHLLAPPTGSVVLDMCAAPGMKTTQLAAYMRNEGKIYAVERNEKRYKTLCDFVEKTHSKCVETIHKDSLEIKRGEMDDVEYILLDPSCSGSGMELCVHNYIDATRLSKLTSLQEKFLKHAMNAFPKAKRIVYSTCSLFPEENERVITNVVKTSRAKWRVQDVKELLKGNWNNIGSGMYGSMGTRCLYARPDSDLTIGFFLAVLDRDEKDMEKGLKSESVEVDENKVDENLPNKIGKKKKEENNQNSMKETSEEAMTQDIVIKKKKKKSKHKNREETIIGGTESNENNHFNEENNLPDDPTEVLDKSNEKQSKKKKKRKINEDDHEVSKPEEQLAEQSEELQCKRKKKKKSKHREDELSETQNVQVEENGLPKKKKKKKHVDHEIELS